MKVLIINGPNINMLGKREAEHYGDASYEKLCSHILNEADMMNIAVEIYQSNIEGELINKIHNSEDYDALIINPGAYTHYSIAIYDALMIVSKPIIEVHISNIYKREEFRHKSVTASACIGQIAGFGVNSYVLALNAIKDLLAQ